MQLAKVLEQCVAQMHQRPIIRLGSHGPLVQEWQALMQKQVAPSLKPSGFFDGPTQAATMAFQRKSKLPPDGVVSSKTWSAGAVAPCYALAAARQQQQAAMPKKAHWWSRATQAPAAPVRGLGDLGLSFSVLDVKSMVLGGVLGLGIGAVLFRKK